MHEDTMKCEAKRKENAHKNTKCEKILENARKMIKNVQYSKKL